MHEIKFGNYVEVLALLFFVLLENKLLRVVDKGPGQREREKTFVLSKLDGTQ